MTPACLGFVLLLGISILIVPKRYLIVPYIVGMCFVPADESLQIATLDFQALRIIAIFGLFKICIENLTDNFTFNAIDKLFFSYHLLGSIIYIIASQNLSSAVVYKCGQFVDSIIIYIVFRSAIINKNSVYLSVKTIAICIALLMPFCYFEFFSGINLFSIFGRQHIAIRDGEIRAATTFSHSILFGSFAAACIPLLWGEFKRLLNKYYFGMILFCLFFIFASSSSGPIVAFVTTFAFLTIFKWKNHSRKIFNIGLLFFLFIHFVREKSIWHFLYVRISVKSSSTGYYRYQLTEAAAKEFWDWWLIGYGDIGAQWHVKYWPRNFATFTDITNHYLLEGVRGGFFTMLIFIVLCYITIKTFGTYAIQQKNIRDQWFWWGWAAIMFTHCITFLSVAYFGQITMLLYLTFAVAALVYDLKIDPTVHQKI